jgi:hypothetical protein
MHWLHSKVYFPTRAPPSPFPVVHNRTRCSYTSVMKRRRPLHPTLATTSSGLLAAACASSASRDCVSAPVTMSEYCWRTAECHAQVSQQTRSTRLYRCWQRNNHMGLLPVGTDPHSSSTTAESHQQRINAHYQNSQWPTLRDFRGPSSDWDIHCPRGPAPQSCPSCSAAPARSSWAVVACTAAPAAHSPCSGTGHLISYPLIEAANMNNIRRGKSGRVAGRDHWWPAVGRWLAGRPCAGCIGLHA